MNLLEILSLNSVNVLRKKPNNYKSKDQMLFGEEISKKLPAVFPILRNKSNIPPCGKLFNGISFNLFQFNTKINLMGLVKSYLKSFLFLIKIRKITKFETILYVTNSNSHNFFHWFLDVMQKLEFIYQNREYLLNLKIIIPNTHNNDYIKNSLDAFDLNFYYQKNNEFISSKKSILLPDIAPTGNYRKEFILKLSERMKNYWMNYKSDYKPYKRIYISRKSSKRRKLKNENEIIPILKKHNFTIVDFDEINFNEQLQYILDCEIIISLHGAGLTHMLWMKQKGVVFEIRAKENYNDNCYFSLASDLGHDYYYINAEKASFDQSNHLSDLLIDPDYFSFELDEILSKYSNFKL